MQTGLPFQSAGSLIGILLASLLVSRAANAERLAYIAGPLGFSEAGRKFQYENLIPCLNAIGIAVVDPWKLPVSEKVPAVNSLPFGPERRAKWQKLDKEIGKSNEAALLKSDIVVAVLDGVDVDSGTAAEIGYAAALKKPIFGYRGDFRLSSDNEGSVVNLQVEYFIEREGGHIYESLSNLASAIAPKSTENAECGPTQIVQSTGPSPVEMAAIGGSDGVASTDQVKDLIDFIKKTIAILFALSLGESFKQFVADKDDPAKRVIHYNRLPALLALVLLMLPFYQGIYRYIFDTYQMPPTSKFDYSWNLLFDTAMFLCESAIFFIMSRALDPLQWTRFTRCVALLVIIDGLWAVQAYLSHGATIKSWIILDAASFLAIILLRAVYFRGHWNGRPDVVVFSGIRGPISFNFWPWLVCALSALRTAADYWSDWGHYFP